jgi:hypothetical protein
MSGKPPLTCVYLSGGLGNQLFQIAAGLRYSKGEMLINISQIKSEFELRDFLKQLGQYRRLRIRIDNSRPNWIFIKSYNLLLRSSQISKSSTTSKLFHRLIKSIALSGVLISEHSFVKVISDSYSRFSTPTRSIYGRRNLVIGYFQRIDIADEIVEFLNQYLSDSFPGEFHYKPKAITDLTLHIRRGDYSNDESIGMLSDSYFQSAIENVKEMKAVSKITLYSNGDYNQLSSAIGINFVDLDPGGIESKSTLGLLASMRAGSTYVISNSTLSWWAAYLCQNPNKQIYAPWPWFRKLDEPVNFIPNSWKRFPSKWDTGSGL